jgi:zinc transport system substrate-binding protein
MKEFDRRYLFAAICLCFLFLPCPARAEPIPILVSILPQKTFVEKVGGNLVGVSALVLPGANPHVYEPKPAQMASVSKAKIFFAVGIGFEDAWLGKFASMNPGMRIVRMEEGIEKIAMEGDHQHEEANGKTGKEQPTEHGTLDPHVWLSPPNVKIMARNTLKALIEVDPANTSTYEANFRRFAEEIDRLHAELKTIFEGKRGAKFMCFHPAWGYFARTYGLVQVPVEIEGKEPKPPQLMRLIGEARKEGIKVVFVQPQFSAKSAETIAKAIGGEVAVADDLRPDWAENLREQAARFKAALP